MVIKTSKEIAEEAFEIKEGVHSSGPASSWVKPDDPLVLEKLEWFRDQKLALMIHYGPSAQMGVGISWPLSDADKSWSREYVDWIDDDEEFKQQYFDLNKTFNPIRFQPDAWAEAASEGGFKYLIFTTKHHDGFALWDTKTTDYRITGKDCPFHTHKYADITRNVFDAFRKKDIAIASYFSKPDWNSPYYWAPNMERGHFTDRNPSYDPEKYPWLWDNFVDFTHEQIMELMSNYGKIDILWLDGGQVNRGKQDIRLGKVVEKARKIQPGLVVADRTIGGEFENYITPEQDIPEYAMDVPWESCITMTRRFHYEYDEIYKPIRQIIQTLIEIVAKGGNLALNVAPQPDGRFAPEAVSRMKELGKWLDTYGEAIYGTRIYAPYFTEKMAFTKKDQTTYCFRLYEEDEEVDHNESITVPYTGKASRVDILGGQENINFENTEEGLKVKASPYNEDESLKIAEVFKII